MNSIDKRAKSSILEIQVNAALAGHDLGEKLNAFYRQSWYQFWKPKRPSD